jgi:hypothetical protein
MLMGKFLKHIIGLILMLSSMAILLDRVYDYIYFSTSARDKVQLALKQEQGHVDYIFIGNSRVENYIDCSLIKDLTGKTCENYALSGGSYKDAFVLLNLLKKNGLTYGNLFIQLDTSLKNEEMSKSFKASLIPFVESYKVEIENVDFSLTWSQRNLPFYRYAQYDYLYGVRALAEQIFKDQDDEVVLGYLPKYYTGTAYSGSLSSLTLQNRFVELLRKQALQDHAKVYFFTSPYCSEMKNLDVFNELDSLYPEYVNYASFYQNPQYFANCTHMSHEGAQVFTKQIIKDFNL